MWSLSINNESNTIARAYWKTRGTSIMLARILKVSMELTGNPKEAYYVFLDMLVTCEMHEELHIFLKFVEGKHANSEKLIEKLAAILAKEMEELMARDYVQMFWDILSWMEEKEKEIWVSE
jgi:hypothetical protein